MTRVPSPFDTIGAQLAELSRLGDSALAWRPAADIFRDGRGWVVKLELAGVRAEDVHWEISQRTLSVRGVRSDVGGRDIRETHRMEISYSHFARALELPCDPSGLEISADCLDGMVFIRLYKRGRAR